MQGRNKKAVFGEFNHGVECSFAVTSGVTLDFTLLEILSLIFLISIQLDKRQDRDQYEESDRVVPEKALNLRQ